MKLINYLLLLTLLIVSTVVFAQKEQAENQLATEWESISLGKLQKKPIFKEPMISARFIYEDNTPYLHLSLKYMFTDAVFDEAVPVEYYKNQKIEFDTNDGKYDLKSAKYSKARRMNYVAQKTADIKVLFSGDMSFFKDKLVKNFVVHYAQGYQSISLNKEEAITLQECYNKFQKLIVRENKTSKPAPKSKPATTPKQKEEPEVAKPETAKPQVPIDQLRKQAKRWGK